MNGCKLYCVRHGQAACQIGQDAKRSLTPRGREEVLGIARHLATRQVKIPRIIHSGKLRAEQTAQIFAQTLKTVEVTFLTRALDCEAEVDDLIELIPLWTEDTLLVGHLPFMPRLINALLGKPIESNFLHFPPATCVCLEQQCGQWFIRWAINPDII